MLVSDLLNSIPFVTDYPPRPGCSKCVGWRKRNKQSNRFWHGKRCSAGEHLRKKDKGNSPKNKISTENELGNQVIMLSKSCCLGVHNITLTGFEHIVSCSTRYECCCYTTET